MIYVKTIEKKGICVNSLKCSQFKSFTRALKIGVSRFVSAINEVNTIVQVQEPRILN